MSGPDRLQDELKHNPEFLRRFYLDAQMQLNDRLQHHGVAMVACCLTSISEVCVVFLVLFLIFVIMEVPELLTNKVIIITCYSVLRIV